MPKPETDADGRAGGEHSPPVGDEQTPAAAPESDPTPAGRSDETRPPLIHTILRESPGRLTRRARVAAKQVVVRQVRAGSRHAFRTDLTAMFLAGLYTGAVFPFIGIIARDDLKASKEILAFMTAAPFLGNLMALFWARAMEGKKKVPFVKWSHIGARLMIFLSFAAVGAWPFALVTSFCQVIGAVATPAYAAIIQTVYPDDQRGRILSYTRAAILAAQIFSTVLVGWLLGTYSYRVIFPVASLIGIAAAFIFSRILNEDDLPETEQTRKPVGENLKETAGFIWSTLGILREDVAYRWFALSVFTYGFGNLMTVPLIPIIQVNELHMAKSELGLLANISQLIAIPGYFFWGRYVDRESPQKAVVYSILLNLLVPLNYVLTGFWPGANAWSLLPAYIASGVVMAGIDLSYFNALLTFAGPTNVSRYQALQSFLLGIRGSVAPFIGSGVATALEHQHLNIRWVFVAGMVFMAFGAWMQLMASRRQVRMKDER